VAVKVAFKMRETHREIMKKWANKLDSMNTPLGIGIATGDMVVGEIGCALRTDYTGKAF
jgi:class 3 adenylate cyclase